MKWTDEAEQLLGRVPPFVRPVARRTAEKRARAEGKTAIGRLEVMRAMPKRGAPKGDALARLIEDAERAAREATDSSEGHELTVCGGIAGCPLAMADTEEALEAMRKLVADMRLGEVISERIDGPVLSHSRIKLTVAGCPNACSEPQIKDIALVAHAWPETHPGLCTQCLACQKACPDGTCRVDESGPHVDEARCIGCGRCVTSCEEGAITARATGWDVLVGGRLGRHPRLARPVNDEPLSLEDALATVRRELETLVRDGLPGERIAAMMDRTGRDSGGP